MALTDFLKRMRVGRRANQPQRETDLYPQLVRLGRSTAAKTLPKPTPRNLRMFSKTPYARRAINAIKLPVAMLDWEVSPLPGIDMNSEMERQIAVATNCLTMPNTDDSFRSFIEQVLEDVFHGAGAVEMQLGGDAGHPLWLFPVDGLSIALNPNWDGKPSSVRYEQLLGYGTTYGGGNKTIPLRNDELIYLKPNPSTATPFGLGPLEVAFQSISRLLGVAEFAGNVSTNARPSIMLNLGENATSEVIQAFRSYWRNEVEGQGIMPIIGGRKDAASIPLHPEGDAALYLNYQEFLKSEIAVAFDLSPQNLGVERDVNRSTGEVAETRDWDQAIVPYADMISSYLTREAIQGKLGFSQLQFRFPSLNEEDEKAQAEVASLQYTANSLTPNEMRQRRGEEPLTSPFADMLFIEAQIASAKAGLDAATEAADAKNTNNPKAG